MLTQAQINAVFTNMPKTFTVDGHDYTANVTYPNKWNGKIASPSIPVILLHYISDPILKIDSVGKTAERDTALLSIDVYTYTDHTHGIHGIDIAREISRVLLLWFKKLADAALIGYGLKALNTLPATDMSDFEEKINRFHFEVYILYKLI